MSLPPGSSNETHVVQRSEIGPPTAPNLFRRCETERCPQLSHRQSYHIIKFYIGQQTHFPFSLFQQFYGHCCCSPTDVHPQVRIQVPRISSMAQADLSTGCGPHDLISSS